MNKAADADAVALSSLPEDATTGVVEHRRDEVVYHLCKIDLADLCSGKGEE